MAAGATDQALNHWAECSLNHRESLLVVKRPEGRTQVGEGHWAEGEEEGEVGSVVGTQGWFLFIFPVRASHCVFTAGAEQCSALGHIGHV